MKEVQAAQEPPASVKYSLETQSEIRKKALALIHKNKQRMERITEIEGEGSNKGESSPKSRNASRCALELRASTGTSGGKRARARAAQRRSQGRLRAGN